MVTTVSKFRDDLSGKLFDKLEDAMASEHKHRDIQNAFSFYGEVVDDTCDFQNGEYCVQRDEDFYNRLLDTLVDCVKKWYPEIASRYIEETGSFDRDNVKESFVGMQLSEASTDSSALSEWWDIQCSICPICFREYGQPIFALNCKHDGSVPTKVYVESVDAMVLADQIDAEHLDPKGTF